MDNPTIKDKGTHRGFNYLVLSMPMGHRCGYVQIPESHPLYGKHCSEETVWQNINVHGGLTFSEHMIEGDCGGCFTEGYWLGFDCNHICDMPDPDEKSRAFLNRMKKMNALNKFSKNMSKILDEIFGIEPWMKSESMFPKPKIRNNGFVVAQCRSLCDQLAEIQVLENLLEK